jgi:hypothetical protein
MPGMAGRALRCRLGDRRPASPGRRASLTAAVPGSRLRNISSTVATSSQPIAIGIISIRMRIRKSTTRWIGFMTPPSRRADGHHRGTRVPGSRSSTRPCSRANCGLGQPSRLANIDRIGKAGRKRPGIDGTPRTNRTLTVSSSEPWTGAATSLARQRPVCHSQSWTRSQCLGLSACSFNCCSGGTSSHWTVSCCITRSTSCTRRRWHRLHGRCMPDAGGILLDRRGSSVPAPREWMPHRPRTPR